MCRSQRERSLVAKLLQATGVQLTSEFAFEMAVFFDYPVQTPGLGALTHHEVAWHTQFALLAVASKNESSDADGTVHFYLEEVGVH